MFHCESPRGTSPRGRRATRQEELGRARPLLGSLFPHHPRASPQPFPSPGPASLASSGTFPARRPDDADARPLHTCVKRPLNRCGDPLPCPLSSPTDCPNNDMCQNRSCLSLPRGNCHGLLWFNPICLCAMHVQMSFMPFMVILAQKI